MAAKMNLLILGPENRNKNIIESLKGKHKIFVTENEITLEYLKNNNIEFMISNGYAPIIKPPITTDYKNKIVNIHPAYLPHGRGIYPNFWSFFEGFPKGATVHCIDEGIDTGAILFRKEIQFEKTDTLRTTIDMLMQLAENLFLENAEDIFSGNVKILEQEDLVNPSIYHNRLMSEYFIELLPNGWDTKIGFVEKMGRDFLLSTNLINSYLEDIENVN
jgi:folate-dependent phosphoribosylglycinamide formyltransferase PurN